MNVYDGLAAACRQRAGYAEQMLERLIALPSLEGETAIEDCLDLIESELGSLAEETLRPERDGLTSLIMRFGPGPSRLAFSGHVDVVPVDEEGWATPPFELARRDGNLLGRGVADMKGGVAGFVAAIRALDDVGLLEGCGVELVLTGDEEVGSRRGLIPLLEQGLVAAPAAVCGEPTGLDVFLGNRGLIWAEVRISGRGGHAGQAHVLDNPIEPALALAEELAKVPLDARDERFAPPAPSLTLTKLAAGEGHDAVNIVPDKASLSFDRRLVPGESVERAKSDIEAAIARSVVAPFTAELRMIREWPPYAIEAAEPVAIEAVEAVRSAGRPARMAMDLASNDSSWLDQAGIKTVLLGPGAPDQAHVSNERLDPAELHDTVAIYARLALAMGEKAD